MDDPFPGSTNPDEVFLPEDNLKETLNNNQVYFFYES